MNSRNVCLSSADLGLALATIKFVPFENRLKLKSRSQKSSHPGLNRLIFPLPVFIQIPYPGVSNREIMDLVPKGYRMQRIPEIPEPVSRRA